MADNVHEPLQQRSDEDQAAPVGGAHQVDPDEGMAKQEYSVPGTPNQTLTGFQEDQESSREHEKLQAEAASDSQPAPNPHALALPVMSPEAVYAAKDNIVLPDPRPGEVARVEVVAEQLGVQGRVRVDATDAAKLYLKDSVDAGVPEDYRDQVESEKEGVREALDRSENQTDVQLP
jgi:hypothetical protein